MPPLADLLTRLRRRRGALTDYAAVAALVAALSIGALVAVGDRSRCILADAGRAALGLDPQGCVLPDPETPPPPPPEEAAEPELETPSGALPLATVGQGYLFQFQASDPKGRQITFLAPEGLLPPGLVLTPGGTLVGVPTQADAWTFPVSVRNADGREATGSFTLVVNAPPVWQPLAPDALVLPEGLPFSVALEAIDPDGQTVAYDIAAGALPGATLDPATGLLAGVAPASGVFPLTLRASDPDGASATIGATFTVSNAPVWTTPAGPLPGAQAGVSYLLQLQARDLNQDQLVFSLLDGALPPGLSLDLSGAILGVPDAGGGDATFTVGVSDGGAPVARTFSIAYTQAPAWITTSIPAAVRGAPYQIQLEAQDPDGDPLTFRLAGGLISDLGMTLSPSGLLSSSRIPRNFPVRQLSVEVSDGRGGTATAVFGLGTSAPPQWNTPEGALPVAQIGQPYNVGLNASDPEGGSLSFAVVAGALPPGISLSSLSGALSGTPTAHGTFEATIRISDPDGGTAERTFPITVNRPPAFLTDATLPPARAGETYTARIETADPDGDAVSFELPPPGGGAFAADGTFSVAVAADRTAPLSFLARIRDARNGVATRTFQIPVLGAPVWQTASLPRHFGSGPYAAPVSALDPNGGTVSYEVVSGPPGAVMDGADLRVSPVAFGPVRLRATNAAGLSSERDFEIREDAPPAWISGEDLGVVALGDRPVPLAAADDGPLTFHLVGGSLPDGLALAADGRFTGAASASGAFGFTVEIRDGATPPLARSFTLIAAARPVIGRSSIAPLPREGAVSIDLQIQSQDGPARLSASPAPETIHPSLVLTAAGVLEGEDVALSAAVSWTVEARHPIHDGLVATRTLLLSSQAPAAPPPGGGGSGGAGPQPPADQAPVFLTQALPTARPGVPYSAEIAAADPEGAPVSLTLLLTSQEAPGLDFDGQALFGIPTQAGTYRYDLRAQDPAGNAATIALTLTVNALPAITGPDLLPVAQQGRPYGPVALLAEDAEQDPITWSFAPNGGVPGLSLNAQTGVLSGTPTQAGVRALSVRAADASGTAQRAWSLVVNAQPVPTVAEGYLPPLVLGQPYAFTLVATDADGDAVTATVVSGELPPGLSLDPTTGLLSGTPADDADRLAVVRFADGRGGFAERTYRLAGNVPPGFTTPADLGVALVGAPFSATIAASDPNPGDAVALALIDGTLPDGLSFAPATGAVSGTALPGPRGEFLFTVRASDPVGASSERTFRVGRDVLPAFAEGEAARLSGALAGLRQNVPMAALQVQATDAYGAALAFDLAAGALPAGLSLSASGQISGTPTAGGAFSATVRARTPTGASATLALTGTVAENRPPVLAGGWLPPYAPGTPYATAIAASDPDGDTLAFVRVSGLLPPGLSLSTSGALSGTPGAGGGRTFEIRVSDGRGGQATATYQMTQNTAPAWVTPSGSLGVIAAGEPLPGTLRAEAADAETAQGDALTYALVGGALPAGVALDPATGALTGTPTEGFGTASFTARATDRAGAATPDRIFSLTTNARPAIDVAGLTAAVGNLVRSQPVSLDLRTFASDADGQALILSQQGTLPAGMSLVNGILSGTPNVDQTVSWTLVVSDGFLSAQAPLSTRVRTNAVPTLAVATPPVAVPGRAYSFQIPGADADGDALTYLLQSGSLPAGLTLNPATGIVSGTPTEGQPSSAGIAFTVAARDVFSATSTPRSYAIAVRQAPTWDTAAGDVRVIRQGETGISIDLVARTPDGRNITSFAGYTAQDGLTGAAVGTNSTPRTFRISGTASAGAQTRSYTMTAVSQDNVASDPRTFTIRVNRDPVLSGSGNFDVAWNEPAPATALGNASDPDGDTLTWELVSGVLPAGLAFDTATGRMTGTATTAGETQTLQVRVRDPFGFTSATITRTVRILARPIWVTAPTLPPLALGRDTWTATVVAYIPGSSASPSYGAMSFSPANTALTNASQTGLATPEGPRTGRLLAQNAVISTGGPWTFTATASNGGISATRAFTIAVSQPPAWQTPEGALGTIVLGTEGTSIQTTATDPEGGAISYQIVAGALPPGLSLSSGSGLISGTTTAAGLFEFTLRATDPTGISTDQAFSIGVAAPSACTPVLATAPGSTSYTVPAGCTRILVTAEGGGGGGATFVALGGTAFRAGGGDGARVSAEIAVVPGQVLALVVGAAGHAGAGLVENDAPNRTASGGALPGGNGGRYASSAIGTADSYEGGGGGGGTAVIRGGIRLVVAGGGGGAGAGALARGGDAGSAGSTALISGTFSSTPSFASNPYQAPAGSAGTGGTPPAAPTCPSCAAFVGGAGTISAGGGGGLLGLSQNGGGIGGGGGGGGHGGGAGGLASVTSGSALTGGGGGGGSLVPTGGVLEIRTGSGGANGTAGLGGRLFLRGAP